MADDRRAVSPPLPPDPRITRPNSQRQHEAVSQRSSHSSRHSSRASSRPRPVLHQPQPIYDAVGKAFSDTIDQSLVDPHIDPAFIAKVTELVARQLAKQDLGGSSSNYPPPPPPVSHFHPISPTQSSVASLAAKYTPPASPIAEREQKTRNDDISPESIFPAADLDTRELDDVTPLPPAAQPGRSSRAGSSTAEVLYKTTSVGSIASSPTLSDWDDVTAVERAWEPLFDKNGNPRPRLGHFLRGLALHLVEDYEPKDSLVVTPAKMQRFFDETKLADEQYPWKTIFADISCMSLSTMYQKLLAQHHLVQIANHSCPSVPALTPWGFECFMTCLIQAHPDHEFERLSKAVRHMPVSSADDRKFRFPKELSRRLLPLRPRVQAAQRLTASMAHEPRIQLRNPTTLPPPPPPPPSQDTVSPAAQIPERKRTPYARRANSSTVDDEDLSMPAAPIERERKPYTARQGTAKSHDSPPQRDSYAPGRAEEASARLTRPQSNGPSHAAPGMSDPRAIPNGGRFRNSGTAPPLSYNNFPRNAGSSYARSDVGSLSGSESGHMQYVPSSVHDTDDGDRRAPRRQTVATPGAPPMDDLRGTPIPLRPGQSDPYASSMPPQLSPLGTSFPSQQSQPLHDERRRSAYSAVPGANDGWSSFSSAGSAHGDAAR